MAPRRRRMRRPQVESEGIGHTMLQTHTILLANQASIAPSSVRIRRYRSITVSPPSSTAGPEGTPSTACRSFESICSLSSKRNSPTLAGLGTASLATHFRPFDRASLSATESPSVAVGRKYTLALSSTQLNSSSDRSRSEEHTSELQSLRHLV